MLSSLAVAGGPVYRGRVSEKALRREKLLPPPAALADDPTAARVAAALRELPIRLQSLCHLVTLRLSQALRTRTALFPRIVQPFFRRPFSRRHEGGFFARFTFTKSIMARALARVKRKDQ